MINAIFRQKLKPLEIAKVEEVSNKLNVNPNWLLSVFYFETAYTLSPSKTNPIGSVGLIGFTRDSAGTNYKTINGKRYLLSDLAKMSFIQQMDVVYAYYNEVYRMMKITSLNSFIDVYLVTFFPAALNKPLDYVFETKNLSRSLIAKQNPIFDRNKDGKIQKSEVVSYFEGLTTFKVLLDDIKDSKKKTCSLCGLSILFVFCYSFLAFAL